MYISLKHKILFFHIPKNAGTAIREALHSVIPNDPKLTEWSGIYHSITNDHQGLHFVSKTKILPYHGFQPNIKIFLDYIGQRVDNFFEFVVIRHPYDRVISFAKFSNTKTMKYQSLTIDEVLDIIEEGSNSFFKTQFAWIDQPLTKKLHIYRYEELNTVGWDDIRNQLKLDLPNLELINVSPNDDIALTSDQKARCYDLLKREFDELGYQR